MSWSSFWTGVAAAATVVAVVAALVAQWRARARVVVEAVEHKYLVPPALKELIERLTDFRIRRGFHRAREGAEVAEGLDEFAEELDKLAEVAGHPSVKYSASRLWSFEVTNKGHEPVSEVELQVPEALVSVVTRSNGTTETISGPAISISTIRPGDKVTVLTWAQFAFEGPRVLQARGRARLRRLKLVGRGWARIYQLFHEAPLATLYNLVLLMLLLLAILQIILVSLSPA